MFTSTDKLIQELNVQFRLQATSFPAALAASNGRNGALAVYRTFGSMRHFLENGHRLARLRHTTLRIMVVMMSMVSMIKSTMATAVAAWEMVFRRYTQVTLPAFNVRKPTVTYAHRSISSSSAAASHELDRDVTTRA